MARATLSEALSLKDNSLNALRLVLALVVLVSHALKLGGFGSEEILQRTTYGTIAVDGFFAFSGYLITASALRNRLPRFLWLRIVRIVPGFWACLVVTGFVISFVGWHHLSNIAKQGCSFTCYFEVRPGPVGYFTNNLLLKIHQRDIADSLVPATASWGWNGSLWTIYYEFLCYLMVGLCLVLGLLRRRLAMVVLSALLWGSVVAMVCVPQFNIHFNAVSNVDLLLLAQVVPAFLAGCLLYLFRERVPDSPWIALACVVAFAGGLFLPVGGLVPGFSLTSASIVAPLLAYPLLWLGAHLPLRAIGKNHDFSYGVYLYAFPIEQLLIDFRLEQKGVVIYLFATLLLTGVLALFSWWVVERNAMKLRTWSLKR